MLLATFIRQHASTKLANPYFPDLPIPTLKLTQDFHLDTLFNPIWMDGPNVFSFDKSGIAVRPNSTASPGHSTHTLQPLPHDLVSTPRTYADVVRMSSSISLSRIRKPWKNATLTEQDDAEFEALMSCITAESSVMGQLAVQFESASCTRPPTLSAYEYIYSDSFDEDSENSAPRTPVMVSPSNSQVSGMESPIVPTPDNRGDRAPLTVLYEVSPTIAEDELEKVVIGIERLRRNAPPPLRLEDGVIEDASNCVLLKEDALDQTPLGNMALSPLTAGIPIKRIDLVL